MNPKHKLIMLLCATTLVLGLLTWCIKNHNMVGIVVDVMVLLWYIPQYIHAISRLKQVRK